MAKIKSKKSQITNLGNEESDIIVDAVTDHIKMKRYFKQLCQKFDWTIQLSEEYNLKQIQEEV